MSERKPTSEIVADLCAVDGSPTVGALRREAADRLAELEAEATYRRGWERRFNELVARVVALDVLRLPCPTCGGTRTSEVIGGWEGSQDNCPDCSDGLMSHEVAWAIVRAVFEDYPHPAFVPAPNGVKEAWVAGAQAAFRFLRGVRP